MILFGTRTTSKSLGMVAAAAACACCGADVRCEIVRTRLWFTLFFIPIFPMWSRFALVCPSCGDSRALTRNEARTLLEAGTKF